MKPEVEKVVMLRLGVETDHPFVFGTWLRGLYYGNSFFRQIEKNEFMQNYSRVIQNVLFKPGVILRVACLRDEEDVICGYSLSEELLQFQILHWIHIKPEWRKLGIAEDLIPEQTNVVTHVVDSMLKAKLKEDAKTKNYLSNYDVKLKDKKLSFKPFLI